MIDVYRDVCKYKIVYEQEIIVTSVFVTITHLIVIIIEPGGRSKMAK